jgi:hypothetical protein
MQINPDLFKQQLEFKRLNYKAQHNTSVCLFIETNTLVFIMFT